MTLGHIVVAFICIEKFSFAPPLANGIAFIFATITSYCINTIWSFSASLNIRNLSKFLCVSVFGFLLAVGVSWASGALGVSNLGSILIVAVLIPPVTFSLHYFWTFRKCM